MNIGLRENYLAIMLNIPQLMLANQSVCLNGGNQSTDYLFNF